MPPSGTLRPLVVSGDCTGFDSAILSLRAIGLSSRIVEGFASDVNPSVRKFLKENYHHNHIFVDVMARDNKALRQELLKTNTIPDLYTAGFPCQPFSTAGQQHGAADPRGLIGAKVADTIAVLHPRCFVLENVVQLRHKKHALLYTHIMKTLLNTRAPAVVGSATAQLLRAVLGHSVGGTLCLLFSPSPASAVLVFGGG